MSDLSPLSFEDKILHVRYTRGRKTMEIVLENCRLEAHEDRTFLMGEWLRSDQTAWNAGLTVAIALDCVSDYLMYESAEEYLVRRKRYTDTHDEKGSNRRRQSDGG
jgi:hypothetical protein